MSEPSVRLLVEDDLERSRLTVGLRFLLVIPHLIWIALWSIAALFAAFANWIGTLLLGRPPTLLHRFLAAYVKYATQFYAYLRLAANPYPSFDGPDGYPIDVAIAPPGRQRRLTVLARALLALPAIVLAGALGGNTIPQLAQRTGSGYLQVGLGGTVAVLGWFVCVAQRRMPRGLRDAAAWSLLYSAQVWSYLLILTDRYPDIDPQSLPGLPDRTGPVGVRAEDDLRRSRLTTLFRLPLSFPHLVWLTLWTIVTIPVAALNWLLTLIRGEPPAALHRFLSRFVRYELSVYAFLHLVANPFPGFAGAPGAYPAFEAEVPATARQNRWKVLFRLPLAIPAYVLSWIFSTLALIFAFFGWFAALLLGRMPLGLRNAGAVALRYQAQLLGYGLVLTDAYPYTGPVRADGPSASRVTGPGAAQGPEELPAPAEPDVTEDPAEPAGAAERAGPAEPASPAESIGEPGQASPPDSARTGESSPFSLPPGD